MSIFLMNPTAIYIQSRTPPSSGTTTVPFLAWFKKALRAITPNRPIIELVGGRQFRIMAERAAEKKLRQARREALRKRIIALEPSPDDSEDGDFVDRSRYEGDTEDAEDEAEDIPPAMALVLQEEQRAFWKRELAKREAEFQRKVREKKVAQMESQLYALMERRSKTERTLKALIEDAHRLCSVENGLSDPGTLDDSESSDSSGDGDDSD